MDLQLTDKTALITGSTAGIGYAIAKRLAMEGATVYINGRTDKRVNDAITSITKDVPGAKLRGLPLDLSKADGCASLIKQLPAIDILVNNLSIFEVKGFADITDADWQRFFDTNIMSGIRLSRAFLPGMMEKNWGRIIFISSESGVQIPVEMIHYGFTKTAQLGISRGLAEMTIGTNVTVNSVLPGPTRSEGVGTFVKQMADQQGKTEEDIERDFFKTARPSSLIQRFAEVDEVANMVAYLASPLASATNGAAVRVDGGVVRSIV